MRQVNFSSSYISLPFSLTVEENLTVFSRLYNVKERKRRMRELLTIFEILDIKDTPTRRLSSGQITRVCLCKALLNSPRILFLDEPTASLDPDIADKARTLLKSIKKGAGPIHPLHVAQHEGDGGDVRPGHIHGQGADNSGRRPESIMRRFGGRSLEEVFIKIARPGR